jgi:hypothetical protein
MLLAEIISLMVGELSFYGARFGWFSAYGHWCSSESWVFGTKKTYSQLVCGRLEMKLFGTFWLESGSGWGVWCFGLSGLVFDSEDWQFSSFSEAWFDGYLANRQGYQGFLSRILTVFVFWTSLEELFWQKTGRIFENLIVLKKTQTSFKTILLLPSLLFCPCNTLVLLLFRSIC